MISGVHDNVLYWRSVTNTKQNSFVNHQLTVKTVFFFVRELQNY